VQARTLACLAGVLLAGCGAPRETPRNLVVIVVDTLRQDHLAAYGYGRETAPGLSRLAAEGAVLQGLSPTSWTRPATASLLSGLHPLRHQALNEADALPEEAKTLAESLKARGYQTVAVSGNPQVSAEAGFGQGFDVFTVRLARPGEAARLTNAHLLNLELTPLLPRLRAPFFLYIHYVDPHSPYGPPTAWNGAPLDARLAGLSPLRPEPWDPTRQFTRDPQLVRDMVDLYDGEIREADRRIADVLGALDARGLLRRTVTVVTADHGEEFQDHGRLSHGFTLYEEMVRVPLIVHAPGLVAAARHGAASLLDVTPTALGLLGLPPLPGDGRDLSGALRSGRPDPAPRAFLLHLDLREMFGLALRQGSEKLVLARHPYAEALYDLSSDPAEADNRYASSPARVAALAGELFAEHNALAASPLPRAFAILTPSLREGLAAWGYAGGAAGDPRRIPPRLAPPASDLMAWEDPATLGSCVDLVSAEAERQLRYGWHAPELGGRWSQGVAVVALRWPAAQGPGPVVLEVRGVNHEDRPQTFRISPGPDEPVRVPPGPYTVTRPVPGTRTEAPLLVRFTRDPPFVPATRGLADPRSLGVFVTSACLR
jgi:arylsulfatase A-like enzyme